MLCYVCACAQILLPFIKKVKLSNNKKKCLFIYAAAEPNTSHRDMNLIRCWSFILHQLINAMSIINQVFKILFDFQMDDSIQIDALDIGPNWTTIRVNEVRYQHRAVLIACISSDQPNTVVSSKLFIHKSINSLIKLSIFQASKPSNSTNSLQFLPQVICN